MFDPKTTITLDKLVDGVRAALAEHGHSIEVPIPAPESLPRDLRMPLCDAAIAALCRTAEDKLRAIDCEESAMRVLQLIASYYTPRLHLTPELRKIAALTISGLHLPADYDADNGIGDELAAWHTAMQSAVHVALVDAVERPEEFCAQSIVGWALLAGADPYAFARLAGFATMQ